MVTTQGMQKRSQSEPWDKQKIKTKTNINKNPTASIQREQTSLGAGNKQNQMLWVCSHF